jgi:hypothetical protein
VGPAESSDQANSPWRSHSWDTSANSPVDAGSTPHRTAHAPPLGRHPFCLGWGQPDEDAVRKFVRKTAQP